jgi:hypothetical protein
MGFEGAPVLEQRSNEGYTFLTAPEGSDRGVDIIAGRGLLGFEEPRLVVQVSLGLGLKQPTSVSTGCGLTTSLSLKRVRPFTISARCDIRAKMDEPNEFPCSTR